MVKRTISITLALILILSTVFAVSVPVSAAQNTWDPDHDVYDITTEEDLFAFRDSLDNEQNYEDITVNLLSDIQISEGRTYVSPCSNGSADVYFFGTFNGNNHTISNLNMVSSDNSTVSFFPFIGDATIKDLTLKDVTIENGKSWNAAFAPVSLGDDKIINCHLTGDCLIKSDENFSKNWNYTAGIIADNYGGSLEIRDCTVGENVRIIGTTNAAYYRVAGGILAYIRKGGNNTLISNCINRADVESSYIASGIVGTVTSDSSNYNSLTITDCTNYGNISASVQGNGTKRMAGILAESFSWSTVYIDRCINHGDITVNGSCASGSGGIAGEVAYCSIQNTYNTGTVTALDSNTLGGIVGQFRTAQTVEPVYTGGTEIIYFPEQFNSIYNCYNTGTVNGGNTNFVGGLCGIIQDSSSTPANSIIVNAYNFGTVNGGVNSGNVSAEIQNTSVSNAFSPSGTQCIGTNSGTVISTSDIGYYSSADIDGIVYPATMKTGESEIISDEPLDGNLLYTLNQWVSDKNAELETGGSDYRYLTWKMTNPASEDGSKGVTVHPMFGVLEFDIRFYPNFSDNEEPFRTYTAADLVMGKVPVFYDLPAHDGYIFKGWYLDKENNDDDSPISFDTIYTASTDIYAHWIKVEDVAKDEEDQYLVPYASGKYGGFDLAGVQIRKEMMDHNFEEVTPGGMRFITSLSMDIVNEINAIKPNNIEYGYIAATSEGWINYHRKGVEQLGLDEKLKYVSETANGINTTNTTAKDEDYFGFAHNIDCTSKVANRNGVVPLDHQNYGEYLLYSFVATYENGGETGYNTNVLARPYIHYTDANGLERVAYSDYRGTNVLGGCYTCYNAIAP
ncbi:hypothetical protein [Ruminococcus sp.]|uniref:hypothetical protein n=1 Tax=Ruminococcus sp. TaxID=41978 RepID=UPI003870DC92